MLKSFLKLSPKSPKPQISPTQQDNLFQMPSDSIEKNLENNDNGELNPEEWDPW